jgi:hypothetical protein
MPYYQNIMNYTMLWKLRCMKSYDTHKLMIIMMCIFCSLSLQQSFRNITMFLHNAQVNF